MIRVSAVLLLLGGLVSTLGQQAGTCEDPNADVLIMGAGMAGIAAAKGLYDNGVRNFVIVEGTDRIGGRVRETGFGGIVVELGANWIQGVSGEGEPPGDNPLWQLVASGECPLAGIYSDYDSFKAYEGTKDVTNDTIAAIEAYYEADCIVTEVREERYSRGLPDISVREAFLLNTTWNQSTNVEQLVDWYNFDFCFAEPPEASSLYRTKPLATYENFGDYDYFVTDQQGFSSLVKCVGREFLSDESVLNLNTNVRKIRWSNECVCAETMQPQGQRTFCGKYGIVTFSVGVLQEWIDKPEEEPNFEPVLPEDKTNAINAFTMANYLTIFVNFTEKFWDDNVEFILHADDQRGLFPVIQPLSFLLPGSPNTLLFTIVENESIRILAQPENMTRQEIMEVLTGIYGNEIPEIDSILIPTWYTDPFYRGSYSNIPVDVDVSTHTELSSPEGKLYISGEVTDPDYSGFVHGAYLSGIATAQSVAEAIEAMSPSVSPSPTPSGQSAISPLLAVHVLALMLITAINN